MTAVTTSLRPRPAPVVGRATRDVLPLAASVVPFGTVVGVTLAETGLTGVPAIASTALVYAGSAQLATLSVLATGGGTVAAVLAGSIVNARMLLYSAGLSARFRGQPGWFRWLAPLTMVDHTFLLATEAGDLDRRAFRRYWLTIGSVLGAVWLSAVTVGMRLGGVLPDHNPMEVAAPAVMVALLMPSLTDRRLRRVALVAAAVATGGRFLPAGTGIVVAIVVALLMAGSADPEVAR